MLVRPAVTWINPRIRPGEARKVVTGIPGKTGMVYTLDRETGEFLWARPSITQNVISTIDGATGAVTENREVVCSAPGQEVLVCPTWNGGKAWGHYSPLGRVYAGNRHTKRWGVVHHVAPVRLWAGIDAITTRWLSSCQK